MRKIDFFVGAFICLLLDIWEKLRRCFPVSAAPAEVRSILVSKYLGMGSILLATPAIRALKQQYPQSKLVMLTFASNAEFVRRLELIDEVLCIRTSSFFVLARDLVQTLYRLRKERFDLALDFEFFARFSTIVSYLSAARMRVGYYLPKLWRGDLLTHQIHFNPYRHVTEIFAAQLQPLGIEVHDFTLVPPRLTPEAQERVGRVLMKKWPNQQGKLVVINVNASELSIERRWPKENFLTLIEALAHEPNLRMVLIGARNEQAYVNEVHDGLSVKAQSCCLNLAGQQTLDELLALLAMCDLCISNDSGPLHVAAALGRQTVSFFGPESPLLYGPRGEGHTVFYAGIYCSPCLNVYNAKRAMCDGNNVCMRSILPAQVLEALMPGKLHDCQKAEHCSEPAIRGNSCGKL